MENEMEATYLHPDLPGLLSLPDEVLLNSTSYLPPRDVLCLQCVSSHLFELDSNQIWKKICERRWKNWPRYQLVPTRLLELNLIDPHSDWKNRYFSVEQDVARTDTCQQELEGLDWYFNFMPEAGGSGISSLQRCEFRRGHLHVAGFPRLPYEIVEGTPPMPPPPVGELACRPFSTRQWLKIAHFPPHYISRIPSSGEWLIVNDNVTLVSCDKKGTVTYSRRHFRFSSG